MRARCWRGEERCGGDAGEMRARGGGGRTRISSASPRRLCIIPSTICAPCIKETPPYLEEVEEVEEEVEVVEVEMVAVKCGGGGGG